jgi:Ca-activated chloride channel family protein
VATSPQGWGEVGRPEFGDFRLVHTNPDFSTSGLSAVVAEYYAATGKREGLSEADVVASDARRKVRAIERSIVHYGDTTLFIEDQMKKDGPGYASAVAMEEVTLLHFNRTRGAQQKLVAIYPKEGTFYSDNPFLVIDAPWVSAAERAGARLFQRFLRDEVTPESAARSVAADAGPRISGAARPQPHQDRLAPRPQAGQRDAGRRRLRLHGRGEPVEQRQGRAGRLLRRGGAQ